MKKDNGEKRGDTKSSFLLEYMIEKRHIEKIVQELLPDDSYFIVSVEVSPSNVVQVYLDGDKGVRIKDCIEISRGLEQELDREEEDFELSVSSAGITSEFKRFRQYLKNIDKPVEVLLKDGRKITGILKSADNNKGIEVEIRDFSKNKKKRLKGELDGFFHASFEEIITTKGIVTF